MGLKFMVLDLYITQLFMENKKYSLDTRNMIVKSMCLRKNGGKIHNFTKNTKMIHKYYFKKLLPPVIQ